MKSIVLAKSIKTSLINFNEKLLQLEANFEKRFFTVDSVLNAVLSICLIVFFTACGSNASSYADEYSKSQGSSTTATTSPAVSDYGGSTVSTSLAHSDTVVRTKKLQQIAAETGQNVESLRDSFERVISDLKLAKSQSTTVMTDSSGAPIAVAKTAKQKSPSLLTPIYDCPCNQIHTIAKNTTPTGVVAYYKAKYPKLSVNELFRINKPGIIQKFQSGTRICINRKPCH